MSQDFLDVLARHATADDPQRLDAAVRVLRTLSHQMVLVLDGLKDVSAQEEILSRFNASVLASLADRPQATSIAPELLQWARQTFDREEFMAGVREIEETGGLKFEDFVEELEKAAGEHG